MNMMNDENEKLLKHAIAISQRAFLRREQILQRAFGCRIMRIDTPPLTTPITALLLYVSREIPEHIAGSAKAEAQLSIIEIRKLLAGDIDAEIQEIIDQALLIIYAKDLVTIAEAAREIGMTVQRLSALMTSGKITAFHNPNTSNPRRGRRLVRMSEVKRLRK